MQNEEKITISELIKDVKLNREDSLNLSNMNLTKIPDEVFELTHLKKLNLMKNELEIIPKEIGKLTELESLFINSNKIKSLPIELLHLEKLKDFRISGNDLVDPPYDVVWGSFELVKTYLIAKKNNDKEYFEKFKIDWINERNKIAQERRKQKEEDKRKKEEEAKQKRLKEKQDKYNEKILYIVKAINDKNIIELDLSDCELEEIPDILFQVKHLKVLRIPGNRYLKANRLQEIPSKIGNLTNLEILDISNNNISELPDDFKNLKNLKQLYIQENKLDKIPTSISFLNELNVLDISDNVLIQQGNKNIESLSKLINLEKLYMRNCGLTDFPESICSIKSLTELEIGNGLGYKNENKFFTIPKKISNLVRLERLKLSRLNLQILPHEFSALKNLKYLDISSNSINPLPNFINGLENLVELNWGSQGGSTEGNNLFINLFLKLTNKGLGQDEIFDSVKKSGVQNLISKHLSLDELKKLSTNLQFPETLEGLKNLEKLSLWNNRIEELPPQIGELKNLRELSVGFPHKVGKGLLKKLPKEIRNLKKLEVLDLSANVIEEIPDEIGELHNLKHLRLYSNKLEKLPTTLSQLKKLNKLELTYNRIKNLSQILNGLDSLQELQIWGNELTEIPKEIQYLKSLKVLDLYDNKLTTLPVEIGELKDLESLRLNNNPIEFLPSTIAKLSSLKKIEISSTNITTPPREVVNLGVDAIRSWFESGEKVFLFESKLVIVGNSGVGKTTIRENLINPCYCTTEHESTVGIDTKKWFLKITNSNINQEVNFCFNLWDFGGQGKYRALQQFFCTPNSLYLFVTEPNDRLNVDYKEDYVGFDFWIHLINSFNYTKEDGLSPIIFVLNKCDVTPDIYSQILMDNKNQIETNFNLTNIKDYVGVSCVGHELNGEIQSDLSLLLEKIKGSIPPVFFKNRYAKSWIAVKENLESLAKERNYITEKEYLEIFKKENLGLEENQLKRQSKTWLRILNQIGTIMYFPHVDNLEYTIILNPVWVKEAGYRILNYEFTKLNNGIFYKEDFSKIWYDYKPEDYHKLLSLMKEFDLCYSSRKKEITTYFVPTLFNESRPKQSGDFEESNFIYECSFSPFLPAGIVSKLTKRLNDYIRENTFWKNGVVFHIENTNNSVEITEDWKRRKIKAKFMGDEPVFLLSKLRDEILILLRKINENTYLSNLRLQESITYFDKKYDFSMILKKVNTEKLFDENVGTSIEKQLIKGGHQQFADKIINYGLSKNELEEILRRFIK